MTLLLPFQHLGRNYKEDALVTIAAAAPASQGESLILPGMSVGGSSYVPFTPDPRVLALIARKRRSRSVEEPAASSAAVTPSKRTRSAASRDSSPEPTGNILIGEGLFFLCDTRSFSL